MRRYTFATKAKPESRSLDAEQPYPYWQWFQAKLVRAIARQCSQLCCVQLGDEHSRTTKTLANAVNSPIVELTPMVDDEHPWAKCLHIVHIMRRQQHRYTTFAIDRQQKFTN